MKLKLSLVFLLFIIFPVFDLQAASSSKVELILLKTIDFTSKLSNNNSGVQRPDVVAIGNLLYLAYGDKGKRNFQLIRFRPGLELTPVDKQPIELFSGEHDYSVDIRVSKSEEYFWYAFGETKNKTRNEKRRRTLNAAWYTLDSFLLKGSKLGLADGVISGFSKGGSVDLSRVGLNPEAVDDPTPFYFRGKYYIFTRAWSGWIPEFTPNSINHMRVIDNDFDKVGDFTLDFSLVIPGLTLSQNSLIAINNMPYLIGGFYNGSENNRGESQIYAIALSEDLKSILGKKISLITGKGIWVFKTTSTRYLPPYLFINFQKTVKNQTGQYIAVFNVEDDFKLVEEVEISRMLRSDKVLNHATFEIFNNMLYVFYPEKEGKIFLKLFRIELRNNAQKILVENHN